MTAAAVPADDWTTARPVEEPRALRLVEAPDAAEEELGEHIVLGYN